MKITLTTIDKAYKTTPVSDETMELMGYEFIENLFVDSSGVGQSDEMALTKDQFEIRLTELLKQYGTLYTSIRGVGMFQITMGVWTRTGKKKAKRLSTNVLLINDDNGNKIYRLYDKVFQKDYRWYVTHYFTKPEGETIPFKDQMLLTRHTEWLPL